jgi:cytochrome c peroxidase
LRTSTVIGSRAAVEVAPNLLPEEVDRGRRLFFSTSDQRMASVGAGVSCATCHMDGRNDGITWKLDVGPRQTPSLAGHISVTAPFTWSGNVETITDDVIKTSQGRMGGFGLTVEEAADVTAFVDVVPLPDSPWKGADVALGAEVFNRADVGCGSCHSGEALTDNQSHALFGMTANTPSLRGVAATAPYLHDGSVQTLRALVEDPDGMGDTFMLTQEEKDGLVRFLESL